MKYRKFTLISVVITILLLSSVLIVLVTSKTAQSIIYENKILGFSMELPKNWEGKYEIINQSSEIDIYHKKTYEEDGYGRLFTIERLVGEQYTEEEMNLLPYPKHIIFKANGYTYFRMTPTDVQNSPDEKLSNEYEAMYDQLTVIFNSIKSLPDPSPVIDLRGLNIDNVISADYRPPYSIIHTLKGLTLNSNDINQKNDIKKCLDLIQSAKKSYEENYNERNYIGQARHFDPQSIVFLMKDGKEFTLTHATKGIKEGNGLSMSTVKNELVIYEKGARDPIRLISPELDDWLTEIGIRAKG